MFLILISRTYRYIIGPFAAGEGDGAPLGTRVVRCTVKVDIEGPLLVTFVSHTTTLELYVVETGKEGINISVFQVSCKGDLIMCISRDHYMNVDQTNY